MSVRRFSRSNEIRLMESELEWVVTPLGFKKWTCRIKARLNLLPWLMKSSPGTGPSKVFKNSAVKGLFTRLLLPCLREDKALSQAESTINSISLFASSFTKYSWKHIVKNGFKGHDWPLKTSRRGVPQMLHPLTPGRSLRQWSGYEAPTEMVISRNYIRVC